MRINGGYCSRCSEVLSEPTVDSKKDIYGKYDVLNHIGPFNCIIYLNSEILELKRRLSNLEKECWRNQGYDY